MSAAARGAAAHGLRTSLLSDNCAGAHPDVLAAVAAASEGHAAPYGADRVTAALDVRLEELLGPCTAFGVLVGTGANVAALASLLRPWEAVVCAATAHVAVDECGAPERFCGAKLLTRATPDGRLRPDDLAGLAADGDEHRVQPRVLSISQSTELGTVYTPAALRALADAAHAQGLLVHVDGARIANACAALGASLREVVRETGVDVVTLGGTKDGALGAEAVVFLDAARAAGFAFVRKQAMQLASKARFVSAQLLALYGDDLWLRNAAHANAMAARLGAGLAGVDGVALAQPVEANAVFVRLPERVSRAIGALSDFHVDADGVARLMCAWDTPADDVDAVVAAARAAA